MAKLLKIDVSPRGDYSISRQLGAEFAKAWQAAHPEGTVQERDLVKTSLPFIELPWIQGAYSDPAGHNEAQREALQIGNDLIGELKDADEWLITTPMYNFAIPGKLKTYIDHIARNGLTFQANRDGSYTGLLTGKKATVIIASAGDYSPGSPAAPYDSETPYLRGILAFLGVTDVTFLQAGSTWKVDKGMQSREDFLAPLAATVSSSATQA